MLNNILVFTQNNKIYKDGYYIKDNNEIFLDDVNNTEVYKDINIIEPIQRTKKFSVSDSIIKTDTISCVINLRQAGVTGNITALNFANATVAGGGYVLGADAQEESLCRASLLYYSIKKQNQMYNSNRLCMSALYTDAMIYSRDIDIFRDFNNNLLDAPIKCSFITSPAVNKYFARITNSNEKINDVMQQRIDKIISLAIYQKSEVIVLGAFGCGNFGNKKDDVFLNFENAINKYVPDNIRVIFACI